MTVLTNLKVSNCNQIVSTANGGKVASASFGRPSKGPKGVSIHSQKVEEVRIHKPLSRLFRTVCSSPKTAVK